ncbi:MAG TPA: GYF domain-containing protein [Tepidisphaeraceae bacterium]|jgi:hypothetical protein|nr:GYF domain-containing protein [Tepidisphaeraceae bacterium]
MAGNLNVEWYYARNGAQTGPLNLVALRGMIAAGQLSGQDLVWNEGMPAWTPIAKVPELGSGGFSAPQYPPAGPAASPPQPGPYSPPAQPPYQPQQGYSPQPGYASPMYNRGQGPSQQGLAIAGFVLAFIIPVVGLILSIVALNGMKTNHNDEGKGLAKAGMIISIVWMALGCLWFIFIFGMMGAMVSAGAGH